MGLADRAKSKLEELSHGNQQRIQLATALVHDPELLVLDEPFSGLDPIGIATMTGVIQERAAAGVGVVFSSHQLDLVEDVCEDVVIIARGRIVASGAIEALKSASGRQHLEVEVVGSGSAWVDGVPDATVLERVGDRVKLLVDRSVDLDALLARAKAAGEVRTFAYQPPKLSELFMEAVAPDPAAGGRLMPRWRSVWLVARREILERGRSRGFILSVAFTTAHRDRLVPRPGHPVRRGPGDQDRPRGAGAGGPPGDDRVDRAAVRPERRDHDLSGRCRGRRGARRTGRSTSSSTSRPTCPRRARSGSRRSPTRASPRSSRPPRSTLRAQAVLDQSDVDQTALAAAQQPPAVEALDPQTEADQARFLVANIGAVLILVGIFSFGFTVLTGVVEEKQSRVVEVVLSTVRARDLLMGKVLGIGVLGIVQLIVFVVAAIAAALITDRLTLPTTTPGAVALLGLWFILGYLLYSTALGFLGALASRMEEASNASTPVTMVAMISYFVAIFAVINDPEGTVATIATFFPPSAPFVVPLRAAFDAIPPWQIGLSVLITLVGDLGALLDRGAGLCRRRPPARWADQAARRVAVGRGVAAADRQRSSGSNRPGDPPACQKTTCRPSRAPSRARAMRPARALAV